MNIFTSDSMFFLSLILKEGNILWIPHQVQNNKKYFLDSRFRGNDHHCHTRKPPHSHFRNHPHCHPRNLLSGIKSKCHPQLDWGSRLFLFFFNTNRKGIYLGFSIKHRITKNTSWIPAFAGMTILLSSSKTTLLSSPKSFIRN